MTDNTIASMIRVNHAGEYGAIRIYQGQMAILGKSSIGQEIKHMQQQEEKHLKLFAQELSARQIKPTVFSPLWHIAGFALGAGSALLGKKGAMACTVAIESVIDNHYQKQLDYLDNNKCEPELRQKIAKCHQEELEHMDQAIEHQAKQLPCYKPFTTLIKVASKTAIWLSTRL